MKDYMFILTARSILQKVEYKDIQYIEANGDYCKIFTLDKQHHVHQTLGAICDFLPKDKFYRCHRSFIVNVDKITSIEQMSIYLNTKMILIGEQYKKDLLLLINYINSTYERKK